MKIVVFICWFFFYSDYLIAQNHFLREISKIESEYSYNLKPLSESSKVQVLEDQNMKVETQKQSASEYYSLKQFEFKPKDEEVSVSIKTKRIKVLNSEMNIDTDYPFATSQSNKMASDHYLELIEKTNKITYNLNKPETDKSKGLVLSPVPILHPVYDLSGVLLNHNKPLQNGHKWSDTLENKDGRFINNYEVIKNVGENANIRLIGKLFPFETKSSLKPYDPKKQAPGSDLKAEINIAYMEYSGELIVNKDKLVIEIINLETVKDLTIITPFNSTQRSNRFLISIKNKIIK